MVRGMFTKSSFLIVCMAMSLVSTIHAAELKIVSGKAAHSPDDGNPPPTQEMLLEQAKATAALQLINRGDYMQVSTWKTTLTCEPIYHGSKQCYKGEATAKASFVAKKDLMSEWHVTTSGSKHWHRVNEHDSDAEGMRDAYQQALENAEFYCNGAVISPASNEMRHTDAGVMEWQCMLSRYRGTFTCAK